MELEPAAAISTAFSMPGKINRTATPSPGANDPTYPREPKRDNLPRESHNRFIQAGLYGNPRPKLAAVGNVLV